MVAGSVWTGSRGAGSVKGALPVWILGPTPPPGVGPIFGSFSGVRIGCGRLIPGAGDGPRHLRGGQRWPARNQGTASLLPTLKAWRSSGSSSGRTVLTWSRRSNTQTRGRGATVPGRWVRTRWGSTPTRTGSPVPGRQSSRPVCGQIRRGTDLAQWRPGPPTVGAFAVSAGDGHRLIRGGTNMTRPAPGPSNPHPHGPSGPRPPTPQPARPPAPTKPAPSKPGK